MIDEATVERWMRDANPIGDLADVDPDELAHAVAAFHTRRAAIMQAPTQHPTPVTPVTPPPQRRRKAWAFAVAFILVITAIGIAALAIRGGDDTPVTDEPMAPIQVESLRWSRVPQDEAVFNPTMGKDMMWSVTRGGPGFVAVGRTGTVDEEAVIGGDLDLSFWRNLWLPMGGGPDGFTYGEPAVWVSEDGITWSMLPDDALLDSIGAV